MTKAAIDFLRDQEWSGNGQCPECCGLGPRWVGDLLGRDVEYGIGHGTKWLYAEKRVPCPLAAALESLGEVVQHAVPAASRVVDRPVYPPGRKAPDPTCTVCGGTGIEVWKKSHKLVCACTSDRP